MGRGSSTARDRARPHGWRDWIGWTAVAIGCVAVCAGQVAAQAASSRATSSRIETQVPPAPVAPGTTPPTTTTPRLEDLDTEMRQRYASPELLDSEVDPETYVLGPYDLLAVMLLIGETRAWQLPVLPEGVVVVPGVGPIRAAGRTLADFRHDLKAGVSKRYKDFELYCYLARPRQYRVYVTGEVRAPGLLGARASERVSDLVDRAGGCTDRASRREIAVLDSAGTQVGRADLVRFMVRGDLRDNPHVDPGQIVRVPPRGQTVTITGEVRSPGVYETRGGDTVRALLELAGGLTPVANLTTVTTERIGHDGTVDVETFDLNAIDPPAEGVTRIAVLSEMLGARRVFFISPDERQQPLYLSPDETLADLVRRTATLPLDADLASARLATRDSTGRVTQVPVDLTKVLRGEEDRPLRDGDVLSVPGVKDYVYVSGFVAQPGRYPYRPEWTVNDYLGEAGGPAGGGSRDKATLLSRDGSTRSANRKTSVQRGETVYVDRSTGSKLVGALGILLTVSALAISVVALSK